MKIVQFLLYYIEYIIGKLEFGANCPRIFAIAIPAFGYISSLRCEDTASIGAEGLVVFLI